MSHLKVKTDKSHNAEIVVYCMNLLFWYLKMVTMLISEQNKKRKRKKNRSKTVNVKAELLTADSLDSTYLHLHK